VEEEKQDGLKEISFVFYPVNGSLKYIRVIIKLADTCVTTVANPTPYTPIDVAMIQRDIVWKPSDLFSVTNRTGKFFANHRTRVPMSIVLLFDFIDFYFFGVAVSAYRPSQNSVVFAKLIF
jgi:hypothetical protein